MRKFFLVIFVCAFHSYLHAQQIPFIKWQFCFGGTSFDFAYSIIQASGNLENNFVFAGPANGGEFCGGNEGAQIVSLDKTGTIWGKCLTGSQGNETQCIIPTSDGGYAACGETFSHDGDFINSHGGVQDAWIAKFDSKGNLLWLKCLGGSGTDAAVSIIETKDESKDLLFVGSTNSKDGDVSGWHVDTSGNDFPDVWVVRMSSQGNIRWQKCLGGSGSEFGSSIIQTKDGNFVIAGAASSTDGDVTGNHLDANKHPTSDVWILKLDQNGKILWEQCFGGSGNDWAKSIIQTFDDGYTIAATTNSNDGNVTGFHKAGDTATRGHSNEWIVKLNDSGSLEWQKCLGGGFQDEAYSILQLPDSGYMIAGTTNSNEDNVSGNHGDYDAWLVRITSVGSITWQKCFGGSGYDVPYSLIKASDGDYVFAGITSSNDGDVTGNPRGRHTWVVKFSDSITASVDYSNSSEFIRNAIKIYPNPSQTDVHFSANAIFSLSSPEFFDVIGREHFPTYTLTNNLITCDIRDFPSGIYLARLGWTSGIPWRNGIYTGTFTLPFLVQH